MATTLSIGLFFDTSTKAGLGDNIDEWIGNKVDVKLLDPKGYGGKMEKFNAVTLLEVSDYGVVVERSRSEKIFVNERIIATITLK